jgi:hypothetical protein
VAIKNKSIMVQCSAERTNTTASMGREVAAANIPRGSAVTPAKTNINASWGNLVATTKT